jgi:glycosyltransferase involved in cell wall biosynthesis
VVARLTAVLLRFWPERDENLPTIIADLRAGTVPPDEIVVVDQGPQPGPDLAVPTVRLPWNFGTRARYIAALLFAGPYYLFIDDDLTVDRDTVETLLAAARPGRVVTVRGVYGGLPAGVPLPHEWKQPHPCDWLVGRIHLAHHRALVRWLDAEERFRPGLPVATDCADLVLGRVNDCVSVYATFRELDQHGVGLDHLDDYEANRDAAVARLAEVGL